MRGELIKQLRSFPLGKHDYIIDACAYAFNWLKKRGGRPKISVSHIQYKGVSRKPYHRRNPLLTR